MEPRNYAANANAAPPAAPAVPSTGYPRTADPGAGLEATIPGPHWFYKIGESLRRLIVAAGFAPDDADLNLLLNAVQEFDIGVNQTWQDVLASRAAAITYYNTTNKPIVVGIVIEAAGTDNSTVRGSFQVNGLVIGQMSHNVAGTNRGYNYASFIVPPGSSYDFAWITTGTFMSWVELR